MFLRGVFPIFITLVLSCQPHKDYNRPKDNWAFRSVLDGKPRMFNLALDSNLYVSYDLERAKIYKIWKGGVKLDGAVYTTAHGVQPTSYGHTYYEDKYPTTPWTVREGSTDKSVTVNYLGYLFRSNQVTIKYELITARGKKIQISETPEYIEKNDKQGLKRTFVVEKNDTGLVPVLNFQIDKSKIADVETTAGQFEESGKIVLSDTKVKVTASVIPPEKEVKMDVKPALTKSAKGEVYLKSNDCSTCHLPESDLVGPSYLDIAKRYPYTTENVTALAEKIIKGGSGVWGATMMTPHETLPMGRAQDIVHYILSLDGEEEPRSEVSELFLGVPSKSFELHDKKIDFDEGKATDEGAIVQYYMLDNIDILYEKLTNNVLPTFNAVAPNVHLTGGKELKKGGNHFYVEFIGYIESDVAQQKHFRLVSKDGSKLKINGKTVVDNGGVHWHQAREGKAYLRKGLNEFVVQHFCRGSNYAITMQWSEDGENFSLIPDNELKHAKKHIGKVLPYVPKEKLERSIPGDRQKVVGVHPSFVKANAKPEGFKPRIGGIDFFSKDEMVICTWDSVGGVYILKNYTAADPEKIEVKQIAKGLAEPLGIKVVDGELFVLQKQELTQLIDHDGDQVIDEYRKVANDWHVTDHYHEFAFGLVYKEGSFYATLATDLGKDYRDVKDRGRVVKIDKNTGEVEFIARGLRTPNGIAEGSDGALYVADNQGNWIPTSKIIRVEKGGFYGFKYADYEEVKDMPEDPPLVWLPHTEISNSPSQPAILNLGPYKNQMIHGDVTHGGIKRVFIDEVDGVKQGAAFRFIQGLDAGINRIIWGPDGSLYAGGVGSGGNWNTPRLSWYALHRLTYNAQSTFEMLAVRAKSNGMEIELTEPVASTTQIRPEDFEVQQYHYEATERYGGPKHDVEALPVVSANLSDDKRKIFLELDNMQEGKVIYIRIKQPFVSAAEQSLWSTETWYTLTKKPTGQPGFKQAGAVVPHNQLSEEEKKQGWELLFDGKTTTNWHNYRKQGVDSKWVVTPKGELHLTAKVGGNIVTDQEYENFELVMDWKLEPGGNSGLMFNVVEDEKYRTPWLTGPEMQMLDNLTNADARHETHRAGDLYDMIASRFVTANEGGEWNRIRLKIKDGRVEHWQNGYKVVEYQMFGEEWKEMIANSKFKNMKDFGKARKGRLCIQDHGNKLWLRNIKIRKL